MRWRDIRHSSRLVTAPTVEPITVAELRQHAQWDSTDTDTVFASYIAAARQYVEKRRRVALVNQTWRLTADCFPEDAIELWPCPVSSVSSITYVDEAGDTQTLSASLYRVDLTTYPARITPAADQVWPATDDVIGAVNVTFVAGYGSTAATVPESAKQVIRLLAADFVHARSNTQGGAVSQMPYAVEAMMSTIGWEGYA